MRGERIESVEPDRGNSRTAPTSWTSAATRSCRGCSIATRISSARSSRARGTRSAVQRTGAQEALTGVRNARDTVLAGFTTVRDVGTFRALVDVALRDAIDAGDVLGPRMRCAGAFVTCSGGGRRRDRACARRRRGRAARAPVRRRELGGRGPRRSSPDPARRGGPDQGDRDRRRPDRGHQPRGSGVLRGGDPGGGRRGGPLRGARRGARARRRGHEAGDPSRRPLDRARVADGRRGDRDARRDRHLLSRRHLGRGLDRRAGARRTDGRRRSCARTTRPPRRSGTGSRSAWRPGCGSHSGPTTASTRTG